MSMSLFVINHILYYCTGEFLVSMTYCLCYIITTATYPTAIRGVGLGFGVMMARLGAIASTLVAGATQDVADGDLYLFMMFGVTSAVAGFVLVFLPRVPVHDKRG